MGKENTIDLDEAFFCKMTPMRVLFDSNNRKYQSQTDLYGYSRSYKPVVQKTFSPKDCPKINNLQFMTVIFFPCLSWCKEPMWLMHINYLMQDGKIIKQDWITPFSQGLLSMEGKHHKANFKKSGKIWEAVKGGKCPFDNELPPITRSCLPGYGWSTSESKKVREQERAEMLKVFKTVPDYAYGVRRWTEQRMKQLGMETYYKDYQVFLANYHPESRYTNGECQGQSHITIFFNDGRRKLKDYIATLVHEFVHLLSPHTFDCYRKSKKSKRYSHGEYIDCAGERKARVLADLFEYEYKAVKLRLNDLRDWGKISPGDTSNGRWKGMKLVDGTII